MKKSFFRYTLAALLLIVCGSVAQAVTISSTTSGNTATPPIQLQAYESASWSVVGTATGTIQLQSSRNLASWDVIGTSITTGGIDWSGIVRTEDRTTYYRFRVSTITAGSYATTIADLEDFVQEVKNHKGLPILRINDDSVQIFGDIHSEGVLPSTATTSGNSVGLSQSVYLAGTVAAVEGSLLVATTPVAGFGVSVIVSPATADLTNWIGVAKAATSTGSVVDVYYSGFVLARTTGTVSPGNTLVSTTVAGYLTGDATPTTGADVGVALSTGTSAGGLTKIRLR